MKSRLRVKFLFALKSFFRQILTRVFGPSSISSPGLEAKHSILVDKGDSVHKILVLKNGRIFTDLCIVVGIIKGPLLYKTFSHQFSSNPAFDLVNNRFGIINRLPSRIRGTVVSLLTGGGGNYNYYHWLFDVIPRLFLVRDYYGISSESIFLVPDNSLEFQHSSLRLLGIAPENIFSSQKFQHISADLLISTTHPGLTSSGPKGRISPWVCDELRTAFVSTGSENDLVDAKLDFARKIYISRGDNTNHRNLLDEKELLSELFLRGFKCYLLSTLSFEQQVELFQFASIVVGVHGAGFANIVFSPENIRVIEIASSKYCPSMYRDIASCRRQRYEMVLAEADDAVFDDESKQSLRLNSEGISRLLGIVDSCN